MLKLMCRSTLTILLLAIVIASMYPITADAAPELPFSVPENDHSNIQPSNNDLFGGIVDAFSGIAAPAYGWGINIITIIFIAGTLAMIFSALFKNGQWQKFGQQSMLWSFIAMLALRGLPIIMLSIKSPAGIDSLLNETLSMLGFAAVFLCLISLAVSFLFGFGYRLIEHPDFHRWGKQLRSVSLLMVLFAVIIPWLFPIL